MKHGFLFAAIISLPLVSLLALAGENATPIQDKSLVAWVAPANLDQRGGSVLTLAEGTENFDGIVFGEIAPARWMAGSDHWKRTEQQQAAWSAETADANTLVQIAIVYRGSVITTYRNGQEYSRHFIKAPHLFDAECEVLIGPRHPGNGDYFAGSVADARVYDRALTAEELAALRPNVEGAIKPWAWLTFDGAAAQDRAGHFGYVELDGTAKIANGRLLLDGRDGWLVATRNKPNPYDSPIHYRPKKGVLGDTIPFFSKGEYHVFYLHGGVGTIPWRHIVSTNLVQWRELPDALRVDGAPDSFDGGAMFTGSAMVAQDGSFHIFYTGHNDRNPLGLQSVMHATSLDLIHWTKHPEDRLDPDGVFYKNERQRDFRDPYVLWMEPEQQYWMVLCANALKGGGPGLYVSKDLKSWTPDGALKAPPQECPDLFKIGDIWYLIGGDTYHWCKDPRGDFKEPPFNNVLDRPFIYAGKRMFDGHRHVWTGWLWDRSPAKDSGNTCWGGTQCLPRELYAGPGGQLYCKPVEEVTAVFTKTVLDLRNRPSFTPASGWSYGDGGLLGESSGSGSQCLLDAPANYLLECKVQLDPKAVFTLSLREQDGGDCYRLVLRPENQEAEIAGPTFHNPRRIELDTTRPITLQVFVQGTMFECFINDAYALSFRGYDYKDGKLGLNVTGGKANMLDLKIKTHADGK
ncbi:MAG: LamG-like jellyroll fold domain-containing protein [Verrucomicrobiota bacterium]